MAKILGLDLGTNSIGWAVVEKKKDEENNNEYKTTLKEKGVVIFSEGVKIEKGNEISKAAERTGFRSARKLKFRRKLRKYETLKVLIKNAMCPLSIEELETWRNYKNPKTNKTEVFKHYPTNKDFINWLQTDNFGEKGNQEHKRIRKKQEDNPYYYRDKASREKVSKYELGRALYHIAQRRGFLSNRLEQSDDNIIEEYKEKVEETIENSNDSTELLNSINQIFEPFGFEDKKEKDLDATDKKLNRTRKYIIRVIENKVKDITYSSFSEQKEAIKNYITKPENLGQVKGGIKTLNTKIEEAGCKTLGQYFWKLYKADRNNPNNKIRGNYTAREEHYLHEFEIICKIQKIEGINENEKSPDKRYYGLVKELYDAIFFQRPLKSQKGLIGNCIFEKNKPRCPVSHPLFEEFRMWSFINNIKIKTPDDEKLRVLTKNEKEKIIPKFYRKSKAHFDFEDIINELKPKGKTYAFYKEKEAKKADYVFNFKDNTTVSGCPTSANLKIIFGNDWKTISFKYKTINKKGEIKNRNVDYHDLWHVLSTFTTNEKLKEFALEKLKLDNNSAIKFSKISLKKDYASLSLTAIKKILPYLEKGLIYSHAVFMANMEKVVDKNIWKNEDKRKQLQDAIKKVIENNVLDNQVTQVINGLIKNFKKPDNNFTYSEQSKESYKKDVEDALQNFYGKNTWKNIENNSEILENCYNKFIDQLKLNLGTGVFLKPKRTDEKIIDLLRGENDTGEVYCSDKTRIDKLYHPSDIEKFKSVIIKDENNNEFIGLGSPATPSVHNPMAMRSLFQLRKLINTLILEKKIDQDTKINIELARSLNDANKRKAIEKYQNERKELHNIYANKIKELYLNETGKEIEPSDSDILKFQMALEQRRNGKIVSKEDILKYQLWEEQNHICLYTENTIGLTDFLNKNPKFDIEHTIPRSVSVDNTQENKTLCDVDFNRKIKGDKIPYELGKEKQEEILKRIEHWKKKYKELDDKIAQLVKNTKHASTKEKKDKIIQNRHYFRMHRDYWKGKYERFTMKDVSQGFKNSQKVDIGIISKYAKEYLSSVFKNKNDRSNVYSVKGEMVAEFRKAWGLQESFYNEFGKKDYKPKDRSNHIHHCIDAITIACMDKSKYDTLAHAWSLEEKGDYKKAREELEKSKPWTTFKEDVTKIGDEVLIVHHTPDNVKKQAKKKLRKRGRIVPMVIYKKDNTGKYLLDKNGKKIIEKYIYEKDEQGNKIPVRGKQLSKQDLKNKTEGKDYFQKQTKEGAKYYEFVKNKKNEIVYKKAAIVQQGDTVRGSLHQETYYGAIRQAELKDGKMQFDENGKIILKKEKKMGEEEIKYVVRKELTSIKKSEVENIVDPIVKQKIKDAISTKILTITNNDNQKNKIDGTIWMNEVKKVPIKKVRIKTKIKSPLTIKKHRDISKESHKYKEYIYATNDENYCMAIYEGNDNKGNIKRTYELINMLDAGEYYRLSNEEYRKENTIAPINKNELPYNFMLTKGTNVIFYKKNSDEIWELSETDLRKRLYKVIAFESDGRIQFRHHQIAMQQSSQNKEEMTIVKYMKDNNLKNSQINFENSVPWLRLTSINWNFIVQDIDFKISPTGEITKI